jgi:hypothetical protein
MSTLLLGSARWPSKLDGDRISVRFCQPTPDDHERRDVPKVVSGTALGQCLHQFGLLEHTQVLHDRPS